MPQPTPSPVQDVVERYAGRLKAPWLFAAVAVLFVADLFFPDPIPFVDEVMLALLTFLGSWNSLLGPVIYLYDEALFTLPIGLKDKSKAALAASYACSNRSMSSCSVTAPPPCSRAREASAIRSRTPGPAAGSSAAGPGRSGPGPSTGARSWPPAGPWPRSACSGSCSR